MYLDYDQKFVLFIIFFLNYFLQKIPRSVILAGGTMKPFSEFREQLFLAAGAPAERVREFSCGHVVPPHHILPLIVPKGPTGRLLDLTHQNRGDASLVSQGAQRFGNFPLVHESIDVIFLTMTNLVNYEKS